MAQSTKRGSTASDSKTQKPIATWPFYIVLVALFALFIFYQRVPVLSTIFGAMLFALLIIVLVLEVLLSAREKGSHKLVLEVVGAIVAVVVVLVLLRLILHTPNPIDVVPSCSMLPNLKRGDMVVVQGTLISNLKAPVINVSSSTWNYTLSHINNEFVSCVAYRQEQNQIYVSQLVGPGDSIGLLRSTAAGSAIIPNNTQIGIIGYTCGTANVTFQNGTTEREAYTSAVKIANTIVAGDKNNSIVVYKTVPSDTFYQQDGDQYIVHRVYAIINASGTYYVLTKGDNNPGLDLQYGNIPANQSAVQGTVITSIPYLGYLKLALSGSFSQPTGCNYVVS